MHMSGSKTRMVRDQIDTQLSGSSNPGSGGCRDELLPDAIMRGHVTGKVSKRRDPFSSPRGSG